MDVNTNFNWVDVNTYLVYTFLENICWPKKLLHLIYMHLCGFSIKSNHIINVPNGQLWLIKNLNEINFFAYVTLNFEIKFYQIGLTCVYNHNHYCVSTKQLTFHKINSIYRYVLSGYSYFFFYFCWKVMHVGKQNTYQVKWDSKELHTQMQASWFSI